jgi:hypothetical protein
MAARLPHTMVNQQQINGFDSNFAEANKVLMEREKSANANNILLCQVTKHKFF